MLFTFTDVGHLSRDGFHSQVSRCVTEESSEDLCLSLSISVYSVCLEDHVLL